MMREKFVLARALREPQFERLFFLDPFAVASAQKFAGGNKVALVPDPLDVTPATEVQVRALQDRLGIEPGRKTFLYFGELTSRKGVTELFDALHILPADIACKVCLLIAGHSTAARQTDIESRSAQLRAHLPIQIVECFGYIPHADVAAYFQIADVVLAPYPQHDGMSGISLIAAAFEKPVLSSTYGVMGEMTRRNRLGLTVDVTNPAEFAQAITRFVHEDPTLFCDRTQMRRILAEHRAESFAQLILQDGEN
jgi:glycosyltransferase involved in cell wall biosynthesis